MPSLKGPDFSGWVTETVNDTEGFRVSLKADGPVRTIDSVQDLAVFTSKTFGRVMTLDGAVQITDGDEFVYHEIMAHTPLFAHGAAERVLILGGGDGGVARECLRHKSLQQLTLVEIDQAVVDLAVAEFPNISAGAFNDPRLSLVIADGAKFVADASGAYDVIIVDAPDPVGAGAVLFTSQFYAACRHALRPSGVLVTQSGMPFLSPHWMPGHAKALAHAFPSVAFFLSTVPSYTGGPMAHGFSSLDGSLAQTPEATLQARFNTAGFPTRYYTPAVHRAAFALPPYIAALTET